MGPGHGGRIHIGEKPVPTLVTTGRNNNADDDDDIHFDFHLRVDVDVTWCLLLRGIEEGSVFGRPRYVVFTV